ncbi:BREX-3 system phosphatase PglZ [Anaerolineae bacterium CFX9]|nr:BREX-3 system phosphatase PglZ [Anaerolineae bacterium CFX9]
MTDTWRSSILKAFIPQVHSITLVLDPDSLMIEETILQTIKERGFSVLLYDDPIEFRYAFETQFREQWENGTLQDLVVVTRSSDNDRDPFPYDLSAVGYRLSFSLSDIFPYLNANIVRSLNAADWQRLYEAQRQVRLSSPQGETSSADFVLHHVFGIAPETVKEPHDLLSLLLRRHYGEMQLPSLVEKHLLQKLRIIARFAVWPLENLLSDRIFFFSFLQDRWTPFLNHLASELNLEVQLGSTNQPGSPTLLPFSHDAVRVYMDNLFAERILTPVEHLQAEALAKHGEWIALGLHIDPRADTLRRINSLLKSSRDSLPAIDDSHSKWLEFAPRWAALNTEINSIDPVPGETRTAFVEVQSEVDSRFQQWVLAKYSGLHNYPPTTPVMVHHIPKFLARQIDGGSERKIALIVVDGLSLSQWNAIKRNWQTDVSRLAFEEHSLFAWVPTLTSVSRQAIFSGRLPQFFETHIQTTSNEENYWRQFWSDEGILSQRVAYAKSVNHDNLEEVENIISNANFRVVGLVVDTVDKIMHGEQLGASGMQNQVEYWSKRGLLEKLVELFMQAGYEIWLTADHGNTEASGMGRPSNEGVLAEQKGERVRVYGDEALRSRFAHEFPKTIQWNGVGLPKSFFCLIPVGRQAFIGVKQKTVTHGGITIDELIVPFISIKRIKTL